MRGFQRFNPETYAALEAKLWRAYYRHKFGRLFALLLRLCYTLFGPSYLLTVCGAYHTTCAGVIFRLTKGHEDQASVVRHLERFFELMSKYSEQSFDYSRVAQLEFEWWMVDRYPGRYKITRAQALSAAMAQMINVDINNLKGYGEHRAAAMELLGDYHHNPKIVVDWVLVDAHLNAAYQALHDVVSE